jgi:hypothetical protein
MAAAAFPRPASAHLERGIPQSRQERRSDVPNRLIAIAAVVLMAGCSAGVPQQEAAAVAQRFASAAPEEACRMLAPETLAHLERRSGVGCGRALAELGSTTGGSVLQVEVAGQSAQVRLESQVLFLARFPQGWLVTAAGCKKSDPDPAVPYECGVEP